MSTSTHVQICILKLKFIHIILLQLALANAIENTRKQKKSFRYLWHYLAAKVKLLTS